MGSAIATRLGDQGWKVAGWTRSGGGEPDLDASFVVLALFDGRACREVVDRIRRSLRPGTVVVNVSTIAPGEAAELGRELGEAYVHAPVLGSVPAALAGTLQILAAGVEVPFLKDLGTVRRVGDPATAAALKLVANSSLAGAVLSLRSSLRQASALGVSRSQALDVLALGQLGGLVTRKRAFLDDPSPAAFDGSPAVEFTVGALAKDVALLPAPFPFAADLASLDPAADIAAAATVPGPGDDVLEPLRAYMRGHATGDPVHFRQAFLPGAHVEGLRDGVFVSWTLDEYCALFSGSPAPDEPSRTRRIDAVDVHDTVATATMTLEHGPDVFTDVFLLVRTGSVRTGSVRVGDTWRIANKAYSRRSR